MIRRHTPRISLFSHRAAVGRSDTDPPRLPTAIIDRVYRPRLPTVVTVGRTPHNKPRTTLLLTDGCVRMPDCHQPWTLHAYHTSTTTDSNSSSNSSNSSSISSCCAGQYHTSMYLPSWPRVVPSIVPLLYISYYDTIIIT